jgi:hypothetical protein
MAYTADTPSASLLDRMGHGDVTVRGFRSTFRDWVSDVAREPRELADAALAHTLEDETEAAYACSPSVIGLALTPAPNFPGAGVLQQGYWAAELSKCFGANSYATLLFG